MKKLISTNGLGRKEWLLKRKQGITGTDAAAILNLSPYRSAFSVYQDKLTDVIDESDNESMRQGRDLEEYVAQRFMQETGLKVRRANAIYYNEEYPFLMADFDRLIVGQKAGLECKTVSPYSSEKWADGKIPIHYQIQCQHYLGVSGFDAWYIAAIIFGSKFIIHKIERDEELIKNLIACEVHYWNYNILGRHVPNPDGSEDYSEMLCKQYFNTKKSEIQLFGLEEELKRRDEIIELQEKLDKERKIIEQKIQLQLGEAGATNALAGDYRISWSSVSSQRLDSGRLKLEQPEIYKEYVKESQSKRFTVKQVKSEKMAA